MKYFYLYTLILFYTFSASAQTGKLFLLAGQSNAVGNGNAALSPVCLPGTAFEYNILTDAVQPLVDPMGQNLNNLQQGKGSIGPAFANTLYSLLKKPIIMISAGRGGASNGYKAELSPYGTWDDRGNLMIFSSAVHKVQKAIRKTGLALSGIIWMQGERDANGILAANETEAEYQAALENVITRFRNQFGKNLPFYIVLTGLQTDVATVGNLAVRRAQTAVANKIPGVYVAYSSTNTFPDKGWLMDNVHYTQPAYNNIGDSVARFVFRIPYDTIAVVDTVVHKPDNSNVQVVVDNASPACTFDTPWALSTFTKGFYGENYAQDGNVAADLTKWAKWTPALPAPGNYKVYMQWSAGNGRPIDAPVEICYDGGISHRLVDQSVDGGVWNYLGTYPFTAGTQGSIKLSASSVGSTIADAILFEQLKTVTSISSNVSKNRSFSILANSSASNIQFNFSFENPSRVSLCIYSICGTKILQLIDNKLLPVNYTLHSAFIHKGLYIAKLTVNDKEDKVLKFIV